MQAIRPGLRLRAGSFSLYCLLFALLLWAAAASIRLARADLAFRSNTFASVGEAVRLDPDNAAFHEVLAEYIEEHGDSPDAEFLRAAALSPRDPVFPVRLAMREEVEGKYSEAERTLLQTAEIDKRFDTPWALMNYYFRRGNSGEFWRWAKTALDRSYGNRSAVFRLCRAMSDDDRVVLKVIPQRRDVLAGYLDFLVATGRQSAAEPVAYRLAEEANASNLPALLDYTDQALLRSSDTAVGIWNALCRRKLLPFAELDAVHGAVVTNGDFGITPTERGFDWRIGGAEGVSIIPADQASGISITVTGKEPEDFVMLSQTIPVSPGAEYRLTSETRLTSGGTATGMTWEVGSGSPVEEILGRSGEAGPATTMSFRAGAHHLARLSLRYHRAIGTVRWEGTIVIGKVLVEAAK